MPRVQFACEGRVLFTTTQDRLPEVPRTGEVLVVEDDRYVVVDVVYWARRAGAMDRRELWPVVHLSLLDEETWARRLERRMPASSRGKPPVRY